MFLSGLSKILLLFYSNLFTLKDRALIYLEHQKDNK